MIIFTGENNVGKKALAKKFEKELLCTGHMAYYLGIGTFLYGVDSGAAVGEDASKQHIRRFAEVINLMMDAGMIVLATARSLRKCDVDIMRTVIEEDFDVVWVGEEVTTDVKADLQIAEASKPDNIAVLKKSLKDKGIIFG